MATSLRTLIQNSRNQDGFTLLEVSVTTVIIGVLAAIGYPMVLGNGAAAGHDAAVRAIIPQYSASMAEYRVEYGISISANIRASAFTAIQHPADTHFAMVSQGRSYCIFGYSDGGEHNSPANTIVITESNMNGTASCPLGDASTLDWN